MAAGRNGVIRWGIISAGLISRDFCAALRLLPTNEHQILAVAARNSQDAEDFASSFKIPRVFESYDELMTDPDVDVVYIGAIHLVHAELCKKALNAGKHVLCEKPLTVSADEAESVIKLANEKELFLMEGFWSRFFPTYGKIGDLLSTGGIGTPKLLQANLCIDLSSQDWVLQKGTGGSMLSAGCYCVQLAQMIFGEPEKVLATGSYTEYGAEDLVSITLQYPENKMVVLSCSISGFLKSSVYIHGTEGTIEIPFPFWAPDEIITPQGKLTFPLPKASYKPNFPNFQGFMYEAQHVRDCLLKGDLESPIMPHSDTLNNMKTIDEIKRQLGTNVTPKDV